MSDPPTENYLRAQASYDKQEQPEPVDEDARADRAADNADHENDL